ncbi:restriction endonuclease subunit S [Sinorhizobium meliloti]|nr:restriction endonuclease subunit S [Sinorhizobium meliloti]MDW9848527.1 restriction endonuclease subunit S [Sinorhizobium meliloti]MDX0144921.1 restriction endonuclease subunit S [Sinorhizobium meliloti]MDX0151131.1 restriction endonuclease subunit S [Sinorhizobium meliloti]MDX0170517.1 restriction endonuclease subunit S [Sinorhizobium meliloti]
MIPQVPIGEIASEVSRPVALEPGVPYRSVGVKWYGAGVHVHETREGHLFDAARFKIEQNDLIYNDMWARMGSVAIVPPELAGSVASSHFPTFRLDDSKVIPSYLSWYFRTPSFWHDCENASRGSTGRNQIKRSTFYAIHVPLPPLDEQRRIVARIDELAAKVAEACGLRFNLQNEILALPRALMSHQPSDRKIRVGEFATLRPPNVKVDPLEQYHFAGVYSFGRGVFQGQRKLGSEFAYPKLTRLQAGNFVYPKLMAWEGALSIVPPECDGLVVSTEFPVFEIDDEVMLPEVVDTYFRSPEVWPGLSGQSGGTNVRRRRLNPKDFLNLQVPWPDHATQAAIKQCVSRMLAIRALQAETAAELDAMLPAILDKAFKGEL